MNDTVFSSSGSSDCPCIDTSAYASRIENCDLNNGERGFWHYNPEAGLAGSCYPLHYGSSSCGAHDAVADPLCSSDNPPAYCQEEWCYIDADKCKMSMEQFYVSEIPSLRAQHVYYSYSTCNSRSHHWEHYATTNAIAGKNLKVTLPSIWRPLHFKDEVSNTTRRLSDGNLDNYYYDDSIPWQGFVIDYMDALLGVSNIGDFTYTHRSFGSDYVSADSEYTAAVGDVRAGISDVAASSLWITTERLAMSSFTTQIGTDKLHLYVPSLDGTTSSSASSTAVFEAFDGRVVLEPFDASLWLGLLIAILVASGLSVLFSTPSSMHATWQKQLRDPKWQEASLSMRAVHGVRILCDAMIACFTYFFSHRGGANYDIRSSFPAKILNLGFGVLIFTAVAAYTAKLTALLTIYSSTGGGVASSYVRITSMEAATKLQVPLCAPVALKQELGLAWSGADFVFTPSVAKSMEQYDVGKCGAVLASEWDIFYQKDSDEMINSFCQRGLARTPSSGAAMEIPFGFAVSSRYAAGLSFWIQEAKEKHGISFDAFGIAARPTSSATCSLENPDMVDAEDVDEWVQGLTAAHFAIPFLVFLACAFVAILIYLLQRCRRQHRGSEDSNNSTEAEQTGENIGDMDKPAMSSEYMQAVRKLEMPSEEWKSKPILPPERQPSPMPQSSQSPPGGMMRPPERQPSQSATGGMARTPRQQSMESMEQSGPSAKYNTGLTPEDIGQLRTLLVMVREMQADQRNMQTNQASLQSDQRKLADTINDSMLEKQQDKKYD